MSEASVSVVDSRILLAIFGARDQHLREIRDRLQVKVSAGGGQIHIQGADAAVQQATEVFERLKQLAERSGAVEQDDVSSALAGVTGSAEPRRASVDVMGPGRKVQSRTAGQADYLAAIQENDIVLCEGPAGTGKTYLAVAAALQALKQERVRKIVLVRPAVEAGESLGFLPGDLQAKINPYLRPLFDALRDMVDYEQIKRYTETDVIEVIPLAYMRGRTLNEAFMILDEAQNTTVPQMQMFLTRMGRDARIVVSGDATQVDLPGHVHSGLVDAMRRLRKIPGVGLVRLTPADIVRNPLVTKIVHAYQEDQPRRRSHA